MLRVLLDENNDFPPGGPKLGNGIASVGTAFQAVFGTQQGEWAYDLTFGMPWRSCVFGKYFDAGSTLSIVASVANTVPEPEPVSANQISLDTTTNADARQVDITISDVIVGEDITDIEVSTTV